MNERLKEIKKNHEFRKGEGWELTILTEDIDLLFQTIEQQQEKIKWLEVHNLSVQEIIRHSEKKDAEIERLKKLL